MKADSSSTPTRLEIFLLGKFLVLVDGKEAEQWTRQKPKSLVKLLALQPNHQIHREQAMEILWPDSDFPANNLHKALHLARHALEPELKSAAESHFIVTHDQQLLLTAPETLAIDMQAFEQAATVAFNSNQSVHFEQALQLYTGELLPDDLYDDWTIRKREQLRETFHDLLAKLSELYEDEGNYTRAIELAKQLIAADAANEVAHRRLMKLYAQSGNKHQALRQYRECVESLRRELDVGPDQATVELHDQITAGAIVPVVAPKTIQKKVQAPAQPVDNSWSKRRYVWLALAGLLIVLSVFAGYRYFTPTKSIDSLAVLPIINESDDANVEYLSDGITESIINSVSKLPRLKVMARSTVFTYKGRNIDPRTTGKDLGVGAVLTGRMQKAGDKLTIKLELVSVDDGSQLWAGQYDTQVANVLSVQDEIAREITSKLRLRLTGEEEQQLNKRYTENIEAYQLYLQGRYQLNKRTEDGFRKGIQYFDEAIEKDPRYALAYAGLADAYILLGAGDYAVMAPRDAMLKGKEAAIKALTIDQGLAEAHTSLGFLNYIYDWDWVGAEQHYRRAIDLNPNYPTARHWYSLYLTAMLRTDEALIQAQRAKELDPLSLIINTDLGLVFYRARRFDEAIAQFRKTIETEPGFAPAHWNLGRALEQKGMFDEAISELEQAVKLSGRSPVYLASLGHAYGLSGQRQEAQKIVGELETMGSKKYVSPNLLAVVYVGMGDKDRAFEWLNKAHADRSDFMVVLQVDPALDGIRDDPRFAELVKKMGF